MKSEPCNHRAPLLSIIIPYPGDLRGKVSHIRSWTKQRGLASDFELVVVSSIADASWQAKALAELRSHDQLIIDTRKNTIALYDLGAEAARGDLLFITEDHCVAEPGCIANLLDHFRTHDDHAAMTGCGHINWTRLAYMGQLAYEKYLPVWLSSGQWDKVRIRGFAVRRSTYFDAGGLDSRYGHFGESVLAMNLHRKAYRIGYIDKPCIRHVNTPVLSQLVEHIGSFVEGECLYRDEVDPRLWESYLPPPPEWSSRYSFSRRHNLSAAIAMGRMVWRHRWQLRDLKRLPGLARDWFVSLGLALGGSRLRLIEANLAVWLQYLRFYWYRNDDQRGIDALLDVWQMLARRARIAYLTQHPIPENSVPPSKSLHYDLASLSKTSLDGVHGLERWQDVTFRWTGPVARLQLCVPTGSYQGTIDTGSIRGQRAPLGLFWNGHTIPGIQDLVSEGKITFRIEPHMFVAGPIQHLMLVAAAHRPSGSDQRRLGIPLVSIVLKPAGSGIHQAKHAA